MTTINSILCPVDFSKFSRHALDHAAQLARWFKATLTVCHVQPVYLPPMAMSPSGVPVASAPPSIVTSPLVSPDEMEAQLTAFSDGVDVTGVEVRFRGRSGIPVREILDEATAQKSDLIVIGTHGLTGFDRLVLGSVAEKIVRKASCPVLTVPPAVEASSADGPSMFKRILCCVEFSDTSLKVLEYGFGLAKEADAEIIIVHVIDGVPDSPDWPTTVTSAFREHLRVLESDLLKRLQGAIPEQVRQWRNPSILLLRGKPYQEILGVAEQRAAQLIIMGVRTRGAIDRLIFGSTTNHVVRSATCPVLTLRGD